MTTGLAATSRRIALALTVILIVALTGPPAYAAVGTITTTAQGIRGSVQLIGLLSVPIGTPTATWTTGATAQLRSTASVGIPDVLSTGVVTATAAPVTGGGTASSSVAGLNLLGAVALDAISTRCTMSPTTFAGGLDATNLTLLGANVNPALGLDLNAPGILQAKLGAQTAAWNSTTGRFDYTVRGLTCTCSTAP